MKRVELLNRLPNDLRMLVKIAEGSIRLAISTAREQVEMGEIGDDHLSTVVQLLERAVRPESVPVKDRG